MPMWTQHLLVLTAVGGCLGIVGRQAYAALQGRKSRIGGCGTCSGCATPRPTPLRTQFIPLDALKRQGRIAAGEKTGAVMAEKYEVRSASGSHPTAR